MSVFPGYGANEARSRYEELLISQYLNSQKVEKQEDRQRRNIDLMSKEKAEKLSNQTMLREENRNVKHDVVTRE